MNDSHVFTLANGEQISIALCEGGLGVTDYRLKVVALCGTLVLRPNSDNSMTITTESALLAERTAKDGAKHERDKARAAKLTPSA